MPGEDLLLLANLFLGLLCKLWLGMQHDLEKWELWKRICCGFPLAFLLKIDYNTIRLFIESFIIGRAKHLFGHVAGGSCAAGRCEPCQAGNRAALNSQHCAPQSACPLHDQVNGSLCLFFWKVIAGWKGVVAVYQVLYRKWRPQVFSDVAGQRHVTDTLRRELQEGRLSHAYLFTGSRGTGKTTCAKILAKAVNCLHPVDGNPCNECEICKGIDSGSILDVIEIDAASNNGVDNIRDLREEANFTPVAAKYRVYIIDEVHMLSIGAFNALLKTLEEPPSYVLFILATTEVHKLPATILSRCQRFDFRRIPPEDIAARLEYVAGQEGMELAHDAALLIARIADGALRDALSLLDQCAGRSKQITVEIVSEAAGLTGRGHLYELSAALRAEDSARALALLDELHQGSCDMERLCGDLIDHFRNLMIAKTVPTLGELIICTEGELQQIQVEAEGFSMEAILSALDLLQGTLERMRSGVNRRIEMEMALIKLATPTLCSDSAALLRRIEALEQAMRTGRVAVAPQAAPEKPPELPARAEKAASSPARMDSLSTPPDAPEPLTSPSSRRQPVSTPEPPPEPDRPDDEPQAGQEGDEAFLKWPQVLSVLSEIDKPIAGILSGSSAFFRGEFVLIQSENPLLGSFIRQGSHSSAVKEAVLRVTGHKYRLGLYSGGEKKAPKKKADPLDDLLGRLKNAQVETEIR